MLKEKCKPVKITRKRQKHSPLPVEKRLKDNDGRYRPSFNPKTVDISKPFVMPKEKPENAEMKEANK